MSLVCNPKLSLILVCHPYVTRMYSYVIRMSLVCNPMSFVCHSYVLVCHPYVTRMYSYVIRMSSLCHSYVLVCHPYVTRMCSYVTVSHSYVLICHPYVTRILVCHPYVTRMYSCVIRMLLVFGFTMNSLLSQCADEFFHLFITYMLKLFLSINQISIKTFLMSSEIYSECSEY